jgi:hypothetical protein
MSRFNQQLRLPDGRRLGYDERGPADGKPLFKKHAVEIIHALMES